MSTEAEARAFPYLFPLSRRPAVVVRPRDAIDPHGAQETVINSSALFDYAADLVRSEGEYLAQGGDQREEG